MKPRILIIEDNEANRYLARFLLERQGYEVTQAVNGAQGVRAAIEQLPDLIIMDIEMPEMDGYEAADRIHANVHTAAVPIIAFTSYAHASDRLRALDHGFADYIEKPFEVDDFIRRVLQLLPTSLPP